MLKIQENQQCNKCKTKLMKIECDFYIKSIYYVKFFSNIKPNNTINCDIYSVIISKNLCITFICFLLLICKIIL